MVLSDRDIKKEVKQGNITLKPLKKDNIQPASVDLHLDKHFLLFDTTENYVIDVKQDTSSLMETKKISHNKPFILQPKQFALALILEETGVSEKLVGRLEGKSSLGRLGLVIHTTAGYLDPGNSLKMTLELFNAGPLPIKLYYGMKIAQMAFEYLSCDCEKPYGSKDLKSKYYRDNLPKASQMYKNF